MIDEEAVALVGRDATRRGVRLDEIALLLEHRHLVADRRRRHPDVGRRWAMWEDPTGCAVAMYSCTTAPRIAVLRSSSMLGTRGYRVPEPGAAFRREPSILVGA